MTNQIEEERVLAYWILYTYKDYRVASLILNHAIRYMVINKDQS